MVRRAKAKRKQKEAEEAAAKQRTVIISAIRIISYHYKIVINCISLRENNREYGLVFVFQTNKFTDEDIRGVVKSFKMNFPQGFHIKVSETGISDWGNLEHNFLKETWIRRQRWSSSDAFSQGLPWVYFSSSLDFILLDLMPTVWWRTYSKYSTAKTLEG